MDAWLEMAGLAGAGVLAGAMNALAGGGTFAAFPALIASGLPPTVANATSNAALLPGAAASAWTLRKHLVGFGALGLRAMVLLTLAGGGLGALLLHLTSESAFRALVPWLLLVASLTLTFGDRLRRAFDHTGFRLSAGPASLLQFALGIYGGYFGGAVGLLMMATWVLVSELSVAQLAPARVLMLACANAAACVLFAAVGLIAYAHAAPVAVGAVAGGILGARIGMKLPALWARRATLALTYVITALFFLKH